MERLRKEIRAMLIASPERPSDPTLKRDAAFGAGYTNGFHDALNEVLSIIDELEEEES